MAGIMWLSFCNQMVVGPRGQVANVPDCEIVVSVFELQSRNYVHFGSVTIRKYMNPLISSNIG